MTNCFGMTITKYSIKKHKKIRIVEKFYKDNLKFFEKFHVQK